MPSISIYSNRDQTGVKQGPNRGKTRILPLSEPWLILVQPLSDLFMSKGMVILRVDQFKNKAMARLKNGINGSISGKVGSVIGSSGRGIDYIKSLPRRRKPVTENELKSRFRFALSQAWLSPLLLFVRVGFKGYTETFEGFAAAKSYLSKNAFEGEGFETTVNPALMKVSYGDLPLSKDIRFEKISDTELIFKWNTEIPRGAHPDDQVMLLAYNVKEEDEPNSGDAVFNLTGQFRKVGSDTLSIIPDSYNPNLTYHIYVAFSAFDRSSQSDSVYLGTVEI